MAGLSGHMMHPYDNLNLSKKDLLRMVEDLFEYKVEAYEKVDGFGLHILWDGEWKIARSGGDLLEGGIAYKDIDTRFSHNPMAAKAYKFALDTFTKNNYPRPQPIDNGISTYNCEYVTNGVLNVVPYEQEEVFVHNVWFWTVDGKGKYVNTAVEKADASLPKAKQIHFDAPKDLYDKLKSFKRRIQDLDGDSVLEITRNRYKVYTADQGWSDEVAELIWRRVFEGEKNTLREIKKSVELTGKDETAIKKFCRQEMEYLFIELGSYIISTIRLPKRKNMVHLQDYILNPEDASKLPLTGGHLPEVEGFVFTYKKELYKITGSFAVWNRAINKFDIR